MDLICKLDNNALYIASDTYRLIFNMFVVILKENHLEKEDPLIMEIVLLLIEYFTFLIKFVAIQKAISEHHLINIFLSCIQNHDNPIIIKASAIALKECANKADFNS